MSGVDFTGAHMQSSSIAGPQTAGEPQTDRLDAFRRLEADTHELIAAYTDEATRQHLAQLPGLEATMAPMLRQDGVMRYARITGATSAATLRQHIATTDQLDKRFARPARVTLPSRLPDVARDEDKIAIYDEMLEAALADRDDPAPLAAVFGQIAAQPGSISPRFAAAEAILPTRDRAQQAVLLQALITQCRAIGGLASLTRLHTYLTWGKACTPAEQAALSRTAAATALHDWHSCDPAWVQPHMPQIIAVLHAVAPECRAPSLIMLLRQIGHPVPPLQNDLDYEAAAANTVELTLQTTRALLRDPDALSAEDTLALADQMANTTAQLPEAERDEWFHAATDLLLAMPADRLRGEDVGGQTARGMLAALSTLSRHHLAANADRIIRIAHTVWQNEAGSYIAGFLHNQFNQQTEVGQGLQDFRYRNVDWFVHLAGTVSIPISDQHHVLSRLVRHLPIEDIEPHAMKIAVAFRQPDADCLWSVANRFRAAPAHILLQRQREILQLAGTLQPEGLGQLGHRMSSPLHTTQPLDVISLVLEAIASRPSADHAPCLKGLVQKLCEYRILYEGKDALWRSMCELITTSGQTMATADTRDAINAALYPVLDWRQWFATLRV